MVTITTSPINSLAVGIMSQQTVYVYNPFVKLSGRLVFCFFDIVFDGVNKTVVAVYSASVYWRIVSLYFLKTMAGRRLERITLDNAGHFGDCLFKSFAFSND